MCVYLRLLSTLWRITMVLCTLNARLLAFGQMNEARWTFFLRTTSTLHLVCSI